MPTQRIEQTVQGHTYQKPRKAPEDVDFPLGSEESKSRQGGSDDSREGVRDRIASLLKQVDGESGDALSFADVVAHHESVQSRWNSEVSDDLAELGVNVDVPFRLLYDPAGMVTVAGDHPDKEMIESYFTANPGCVRELGDILQYGKLASAAGVRMSHLEMEQTCSAEAMVAWYAGNMDTASLAGGGGVLVGSGGTVYRGLDIRV